MKARQILYAALFLLCLPNGAEAQFGARKKMQKQIDSLMDKSRFYDLEIMQMRSGDSMNQAEIKKLNNEMLDLKRVIIDMNNGMRELKEENHRMADEIDELIEQLEKHDRQIMNLLGEDSVEIEIDSLEVHHETGVVPVQNFRDFGENFLQEVKKGGEKALLGYIPEGKSFYYLSKPGFITSVAEIKDPGELSEEIPWRSALEVLRHSRFRFTEGEMPAINCEMPDFYNRTGCFGGTLEKFEKVSKALIALNEFNEDDEGGLQSKTGQIKQAEKNVVTFIYSTDGNLGFYFVHQGEGWQLFCLEIEDPCSA